MNFNDVNWQNQVLRFNSMANFTDYVTKSGSEPLSSIPNSFSNNIRFMDNAFQNTKSYSAFNAWVSPNTESMVNAFQNSNACGPVVIPESCYNMVGAFCNSGDVAVAIKPNNINMTDAFTNSNAKYVFLNNGSISSDVLNMQNGAVVFAPLTDVKNLFINSIVSNEMTKDYAEDFTSVNIWTSPEKTDYRCISFEYGAPGTYAVNGYEGLGGIVGDPTSANFSNLYGYDIDADPRFELYRRYKDYKEPWMPDDILPLPEHDVYPCPLPTVTESIDVPIYTGEHIIGTPVNMYNLGSGDGRPAGFIFSEGYRLQGNPVVPKYTANIPSYFKNCRNLTGSPIIPTKCSDYTDINYSYIYDNCQNLSGSVPSMEPILEKLTTYTVADMDSMFANCVNITGMANVPTSESCVTRRMYENTKITKIRDLTDVSISASDNMFLNCRQLEEFPVMPFDGPGNSPYMFENCTNAKGVPYVGNPTQVNTTFSMYRNCHNLSGCGTVYSSESANMFRDCYNITSCFINAFTDYMGEYTENWCNLDNTFRNCNNIGYLDFDLWFGTVIKPKTKQFTMNNTFAGCSNLYGPPNVFICTDGEANFYNLFNGCKNFKSNFSMLISSVTGSTYHIDNIVRGTSIPFINMTHSMQWFNISSGVCMGGFLPDTIKRMYVGNQFDTPEQFNSVFNIIPNYIETNNGLTCIFVDPSEDFKKSVYCNNVYLSIGPQYVMTASRGAQPLLPIEGGTLIEFSFDHVNNFICSNPENIISTLTYHTHNNAIIYSMDSTGIFTPSEIFQNKNIRLAIPAQDEEVCSARYIGCTNIFFGPTNILYRASNICGAYYECTNMGTNSLNIPMYWSYEGTEYDNSFRNCRNITGVTLDWDFGSSDWFGYDLAQLLSTFYGCRNMRITNNFAPNAFVNVSSMRELFYDCENIAIAPISSDTVTDMNGSFYNCRNLIGVPVCGNNVINMEFAYTNCENLIGNPVIGTNVECMRGTYYGCKNILGNVPDIPASVKELDSAFAYSGVHGTAKFPSVITEPEAILNIYQNCENITSGNLSSVEINTDETRWASFSGVFANCTNYNDQIKIPTITGELELVYADYDRMYENCCNLNAELGTFRNVHNLSQTFRNCHNVRGSLKIDGCATGIAMDRIFENCENIGDLDSSFLIEKSTNMSFAFANSNVNYGSTQKYPPNCLSTAYAFANCHRITEPLPIDDSAVYKSRSMSHMYENTSITSAVFPTKFVASVTPFKDYSFMFADTQVTTPIWPDIEDFSEYTVSGMYAGCPVANPYPPSTYEVWDGLFASKRITEIQTLPETITASYLYNMYIYSGVTEEVYDPRITESMIGGKYWFRGCNLTRFNFPEAWTDMSNAYRDCPSICAPICSENVIYFNNAYCNCSNITGSPIVKPYVRYMVGTYNNCRNLNGPILSYRHDDSEMSRMDLAFSDCVNITGTATLNSSSMNATYQNCRSLTGIDIVPKSSYMLYQLTNCFNNCVNITGNPFLAPCSEDGSAYMADMYRNCQSLVGHCNLEFGGLYSSSTFDEDYTSMQRTNLFKDCHRLNDITLTLNWTAGTEYHLHENINCDGMFNNCDSLKSITFDSDDNIKWDPWIILAMLRTHSSRTPIVCNVYYKFDNDPAGPGSFMPGWEWEQPYSNVVHRFLPIDQKPQ